jgi:16S rRNA processing protein RimM
LDASARAAASSPEHLIVGRIMKPHGTKGELFVWPLTDSPDEVFAERAVILLGDEAGRLDTDAVELVIEKVRRFKRGVLAKFEGLDDRDAATALGGRYVLLPTDALPALAEGEVFYHQLLGAMVETTDGAQVGTVREVFETEPVHLLEVTNGESGKVHLVPFSERIVKRVDVAGRRIVIEPPPGLLEL